MNQRPPTAGDHPLHVAGQVHQPVVRQADRSLMNRHDLEQTAFMHCSKVLAEPQ